jgi:uncharacterized membrane protein
MRYNRIMNWFYYSLGGAIFYAIAEIIGKYLADEKSEPVYLSILGTFYAAVVALSVAFLTRQGVMNFAPVAVIGLVVSSFVYALGCITYYAALKNCEISEFVLLTRVQVIVVFIGGLLIFHETMGILKIIGSLSVIIGIILISYRKSGFQITKGAVWALITALLFGAGALIDKAIIKNFTALLYTGLNYAFSTIFLAAPAIYLVKKQKQLPSAKIHSFMFISAVFYAFSAAAFFSSYLNKGYVSLTSIIGQLQIPLVILYGLIILKEKQNIWQKIVATLMMIIGAYLLGQ